MRYFFLTLGLVFVSSLGCDRDKGSSSAGATQEVRIGYFANVSHAQAVLGVSTNSFEKAVSPAKISTKVFNAGPSLIEALFAGEIDIGYVGPGPALNAHVKGRGEKIRIIAGAAANGVLIVARKDSGINSLADLAGKRVATPQLGNTQDISAKHYLMHELKQKDLNNVLPIANTEQAALMARKEIDAAWAPEPWGSRLIIEGQGQLLAEEKDLWPGKRFSLTLVVTTPEYLAKHPDIVEKILAVHAQMTQWLNADPQHWSMQLDQALKQLNGKALPPGLVSSALTHVQFTNEPLEETLSTMNQWAFDLKLVNSPNVALGLVDTTILRKLQAQSTTQPHAANR